MEFVYVMMILSAMIALSRNATNTALMTATALKMNVFASQDFKGNFARKRSAQMTVVNMEYAKEVNVYVKRDFMGKTVH